MDGSGEPKETHSPSYSSEAFQWPEVRDRAETRDIYQEGMNTLVNVNFVHWGRTQGSEGIE